MKIETNKEVHKVFLFEVVYCTNFTMEHENGSKDEKKGICGKQMMKYKSCAKLKEEKERGSDLVNLLQLLKEKCVVSEEGFPEVICRSPMRTHDCHQSAPKPYEYPHSTSRVYGGVTRVVEADFTSPSLYRRLYASFQYPNGGPEGQVSDIDLCDINRWLNLCKRDPKFLNDFVEDCKHELRKKEVSNCYDYRSNRNVCSSVSSQFTSPAQSPSERSLTSPESISCEDNSLYYSKSPNIPSFDVINIKPDEEEDKTILAVTDARIEPFPINYSNLSPEDTGVSSNEPEKRSTPDTFPNIGTVMLNLAEDPYESTIDLNQFASTCDPLPETNAQPFSTPERDALNEKLDPKAKENAWARINQLNIDLLGKGDKEGDTQLMILLVSEKVTLEYIYVIVERLLKENPEYLSSRNELNQDALYLAAFKLFREPLVASYLAEALVRGKQDVNRKYDGGNTLLHCLAKRGDTHVRVLERLLKLKNMSRAPVFDVNKKNNRGFTPLHTACESHRKEFVHAYQTVGVLIENGADCIAKDYKDENTPLHTLINESCDVDLMQVLLENAYKFGKNEDPPPTTVPNRQGNTALHLSCGKNTLGLNHQQNVIKLLLRHRAMIQLKNINGCVPSVLVDSSRKQEIKAIFYSHRQKHS